jgi:hypothetical protein
MAAHIAKLTNMVVATENEPAPGIIQKYYELVSDLIFNMSYIQIINKYG